MKHLSLLIYLAFFGYSIFAQPRIQTEPLDSGIHYIIYWHNTNHQQENTALSTYKEKKWYNILPSPAIGYNLAFNRPILTLSMPDIISFINRKKDLKYRLQKVSATTIQNISQDTIAFKTGYIQLQQLISLYLQQAGLLANDSLLYRIKQTEIINLQATTEDVIKSLAALQEKQLALHQLMLAIWARVASLETHLHRSFSIRFL